MLQNGIEWGKNKCNENPKATTPSAYYDRSRTTVECGIFKVFG
jgi:hypothetical protein